VNIILLTHQRERFKKTNTGSLVADILSEQARIVVWDRVKPDAELLKHVSEDSIALLYPSDDSLMATEAEGYKHYIIIDGTWQEARKIYNQSPYLKNIPTVKISTRKAFQRWLISYTKHFCNAYQKHINTNSKMPQQ